MRVYEVFCTEHYDASSSSSSFPHGTSSWSLTKVYSVNRSRVCCVCVLYSRFMSSNNLHISIKYRRDGWWCEQKGKSQSLCRWEMRKIHQQYWLWVIRRLYVVYESGIIIILQEIQIHIIYLYIIPTHEDSTKRILYSVLYYGCCCLCSRLEKKIYTNDQFCLSKIRRTLDVDNIIIMYLRMRL